ncbi:histidine kinase [uncultured Psychroserpens sp.]|uniref:histidine kinase n=1 Tax=uncultured Psychroserpens sp. TaxID=255436 RepID=UPI00260F181A|nr:histidine kinase [uncultured Psychroserpens sp.]
MVKQILGILILTIVFHSCQSDITNDFEASVIQSHSNINKDISSDSTYAILKSIEKDITKKNFANDSLIAENNFYLGQYFQSKEQLDSAAYYFYKAADKVEGTISSERDVDYFFYCWNVNKNQNKYGDCLAITDLFVTHLDSTQHHSWMALSHFMHEYTYIEIPDYEKALDYNIKRQKMLVKASQSEFVPSALIHRVEIKSKMNDKKGAYKILDSLILEKDKLRPSLNMELFNSYGIYKYFDGDYSEALNLYLDGLKYAKKVSNSLTQKSDVATCYGNIAEVYMDLDNYELASKYLDSVKQMNINSLSARVQKDILKYQIRYAVETDKEIDLVYNALEDLYNHQEETYTDKFSNELLALKEANRKEKLLIKDKQDVELKNLKLKSQFLIALLVFLLVVGIVFTRYKQRQFRYEKQDLQMQQRLFRSQMNPHFISNTLYAIQNLVKKDHERASNYLLKFSRLLRLSLENSLHNYVSLEKELESIEQYFELQLLKFPNKFSYSFDVKEVDPELTYIPPMIIQPLVENSIIHGFAGIDYKGKIEIKIRLDKTYLSCKIEDNGRGKHSEKSNQNKSISTALISDFIYKSTKKKIKIENKQDLNRNETGVITTFYMPYKIN